MLTEEKMMSGSGRPDSPRHRARETERHNDNPKRAADAKPAAPPPAAAPAQWAD
jgi:hypothetical protein